MCSSEAESLDSGQEFQAVNLPVYADGNVLQAARLTTSSPAQGALYFFVLFCFLLVLTNLTGKRQY